MHSYPLHNDLEGFFFQKMTTRPTRLLSVKYSNTVCELINYYHSPAYIKNAYITHYKLKKDQKMVTSNVPSFTISFVFASKLLFKHGEKLGSRRKCPLQDSHRNWRSQDP